ERETIDMPVAPDQLTYLVILTDEAAIGAKVRAHSGGKEIASDQSEITSPILQIPAGSGASVKLDVEMSCDLDACGYFAQAYVK
ncbi:MAG: hypothetical protein H7Z43_10065, partial [Clostridia bacterium]|nr:hypothetical protein [Deltaproteobacteria bacterium]